MAVSAHQAEPLRASELLAHVKSLGLGYNNFSVKVSADTAILEGEVAAQADTEKIALAIGNVEEVELVDNRLKVQAPAPAATYHIGKALIFYIEPVNENHLVLNYQLIADHVLHRATTF